MSRQWMAVKEAADFCGVSRFWLHLHRNTGDGPPYHKRGGKIIYSKEELETWISSQRKEF